MQISGRQILPADWADAVLVGRLLMPGAQARAIPVALRNGDLYDISGLAPTLGDLFELPDPDETTARDVVLEPGQVSLHDALVVHGSNANRSGLRRCGYAIRCMPATAHFDRTIPPTRIAANQVIDFSRRPIWLVRGEDRANNDFEVGRA